ncbi:MAG TPA: gliding motility-associated C-terminal domain-containing protein [Bacteroidia bacterium]|jgi:gliding motility-associated-like protein
MKNITKKILGSLFFLCLSLSVFAQPANDNCAGAIPVTPNGTCVGGTTVAATDNWSGTVGCQAGGGTHEDVWYTFVSTGTIFTGTVTTSAPWTGNVEFVLVSSATGCTGPFTIVGSACGASPLSINIPGLTNGATYYFTISPPNGGDPGPFQVCPTTSSPAANCTDNDDCATPQTIAYVTGVQTCLSDCNTGAAPGPDFAGNNCFDYPNSTVWYQVTTGASTASIDIDLTSLAMLNPYFSVFTTTDCNTYTTINCTQGALGAASGTVLVSVNTTYLIAISDASGASGNFDLCVTVNDDNSACNTTNALTVSATSMGSPLAGPYQPGEIVTFCYTITNWQQINCNYLQGIVPEFGDCWAPASFNAQGAPVSIPTPLTTAGVIQPCGPGPPCPYNACAGTPSGTWSWFPAGAVTYNAVAGSLPAGTPMPAGWYFLSSYNPTTGACTGDPTDPDNSYGDGNFPACGTNTLDWNVCFRLQAQGAVACTNGTTDCSVIIRTYADGEIGIWTDLGCTADASGAASVAGNICCTAAPTVTTPVVYCQNAAASPLTATGSNLLWYTAASGGTGSATAPTPSTAVLGSTNYYVSSTTGGCESARSIITVTVNPNATITLSSAAATTSQTVCANNAITNITYTIGGGGTGAGVTGLPAGVSGSFSGTSFTISGTPTATGTFNYTVTTTGTCTQATATGTIVVNPNATISLSSAAGTNSQVVCANSAIANITYAIGGGGTGATVTGLPAGITGSFSGGIFTISGSSSATGTFNYTVNTTGTCSQVSASGSITINPNATLTLTSAAATTAQTICLTNAITNITYTVGGGGTGAGVTGLPAGLSGSFSGGAFTISGTPTATGTFNYTVTTTGSCTQSTATGTITVNPNAAITLTSSAATTSQTICLTSPVANITYAISGGGTGGTVTGLPAGVNGSFSGGTFTISGTPTVTGTFNYTVNTTGTCTQTSANGTITINPNATITLSSAAATTTQTLCVNNTITNITYSIGGGGTGATVSGLPAGVTGSFSAGTFTISGTPTASGTFNYTVNTTGTCNQVSASGTITVNPRPVITSVPFTNETACGANNGTITINATGTGLTYSINNGSSFVATNSFTGLVAGTYNIVVSNSSGCTTSGGVISISSAGSPAMPVANATPNPICAGNTLTLSVQTPVGGEIYTWSGPGGYSATGSSVTRPSVTTAMSGVYTVTASVGSCVSPGGTVTVTVNPNATIALSSAAATNNQTICITAPVTNITYTIGGGGTGATVTGLPAGVSGSFSAGTFTISGTPGATGTFNYTVNTTGSCTQTSASGTITVNPNATITLTSAAATTSQSVCVNTAITNITYTVAGGGTGATVTGLPAGVTGNFAGGTFTISGTPAAAGTFGYTVNTTGTCVQASASGTITVNPNATITLTSAAATTSQTLCVNTALTNITYVIAGGGTGGTVTGLPAGVTGAFSGGTFTISGTPTATGTFSYTVNTTGSCSQTSASGTITVNPDAAITLTSAAATATQSVCVNTAIANITYAVTGGGTGGTVTGLPAGITGVFSAGTFTISGTPSVTGTFNYTVNTTGTCSQASSAGTITVNPNSSITLASSSATTNQTLCINTAITDVNYTVAGGGTGASAAGLPAGVAGVFSGGTFTISGTPSASGIFNYTVTTSGTCVQATATGTITVNPLPAYTVSSSNPTTCSGTEGTITLSGLSANAAYNVTYFNGVTVGPTAMTSDASGNIVITGLSQGTYSGIVIELAGCAASDPGSYTLTDPSAPVFAVSSTNPSFCGGTDGSITISGLSPALNYSITYNNGAVVTGPTVMLSDASGNILISNLAQGSYTNIVVSVSGCASTQAGPFTLSDPGATTFSVLTTDPSTCGGTDGEIVLTGVTPNTAYNVGYLIGATIIGPVSMTSDASGNIVISGLSQGGYTNISIESAGCSTTNSGPFVLTEPPSPVFTVSTVNPTTCGGTEGSITLSGLNANSNYSISYSDGTITTGPAVMQSDASGNIVISGIGQGSYINITVSSSGCVTTEAGPYSLSDPGAPVFTVSSVNPTTCGGTDGTITISGLTAGTNYDVIYTNAAGTVGPVVMTSDASGNIVINGLSQGAYSNITVGLTGCNTIDAGPYALSDPGAPVFTVSSANPTSCSGTDGTITISGLTAGTAYNVSYSNGSVTGPVSMTADASGNIIITGLSQGTYSGITTELSGCSTTDAGSYTLADPSATAFTVSTTNPSTCGGNDGILLISGLSATTNYDISYTNTSGTVGPVSMTSDALGNIAITGLSQDSYNNIVASISGCSSTNAGPYVLFDPLAPAAPSVSGTAYCPGETINPLTAGGTGGTISWYNDAALTVLLSGNASYTPVTSTTHTYYVTETVNGCQSPATPVTLTINPLPVADAGSSQAVGCGVNSVNLDGSASASGATIVYNWASTTGNIISGSNTSAPLVGTAGTYTITVTDLSTGCSAVDSVQVTGSPSPLASFTADPSTGTAPLAVNFTNTSQNSDTYVWDFGDGTLPVSGVNVSDIYTIPGTYTVMLIASNSSQCPDTAYATIIVNDVFSMVIPNIFTPNADNKNDLFEITSTGVESLEGEIYDRWGLKLFSWSQLSESWNGRTQSGVLVPDGTYFYIINVKAQDGTDHLYKGFIQLVR